MSNVTALRADNVSPAMLIDYVEERIDDIEHLYVVAFTNEGKTITWGSGNLKYLPDAAVILTRFAGMTLAEKQEDLDE